MRLVLTRRFLTLSIVTALGTALTLACSDGGPTAPDQASLVVNAAGTPTYVDDDGQYDCKTNYVLAYSGSGSYSTYDANQNGYICEYQQGGSRGRPLYVDDVNLTCKNGYGLLYSGGTYGDIWDFNANDQICGLMSSHQA